MLLGGSTAISGDGEPGGWPALVNNEVFEHLVSSSRDKHALQGTGHNDPLESLRCSTVQENISVQLGDSTASPDEGGLKCMSNELCEP